MQRRQHGQRQPDVLGVIDHHPAEAARRDAGYGHRKTVHRDRPADDGGVEVAAIFPIRPAHDGHGDGRVRLVVRGPDEAAERGLHAEHREETAGHADAADPLRLRRAIAHAKESSEIVIDAGHPGEGRQDVVVREKILVLPPGESVEMRLILKPVRRLHELLGTLDRQTAQHQRVDEAEDGRIGPDA